MAENTIRELAFDGVFLPNVEASYEQTQGIWEESASCYFFAHGGVLNGFKVHNLQSLVPRATNSLEALGEITEN